MLAFSLYIVINVVFFQKKKKITNFQFSFRKRQMKTLFNICFVVEDGKNRDVYICVCVIVTGVKIITAQSFILFVILICSLCLVDKALFKRLKSTRFI